MTRALLTALLGLGLGLVGCSEPVDLTVVATATNGQAISSGSIEILGKDLKADLAYGRAELKTLHFSGRTGIRIAADGYETVFRSVDIPAGQSYQLDVQLRPAPAAHHIVLPAVGNSARVQEGIAHVTIAGGGLVRPDGSVASGEADVLVIPYDPLTREEAPSTMETVDGRRLMSVGMSTIKIEQDGVELQPKAGMPIEWGMDVNPGLQLMQEGGRYRLFFVDEAKAQWVPEPRAELSYDESEHRFVAKLPHLSVWNVDYAWAAGSCITGQIRDAHHNLVTDPAVSVLGIDVSQGMSVDGTSAAYSFLSRLGVRSPQYLGDLFMGGTPESLAGYGILLPADYYDNAADLNGRYDDRFAAQRPINDGPVFLDGELDNPYTRVSVSIDPGAYFIPVPLLTPSFYDSLSSAYGLTMLPMQVTVQNLNVLGQQLYRVLRNGTPVAASLSFGPIAPAAWTCDHIDFELCLPGGSSCAAGDACCDGNGCPASGVCGPGGTPTPTACHNASGSCTSTVDCCGNARYCLNGSCAACLPGGARGCGTDADCCAGSCINGTCATCNDVGAACTSNGECCANSRCVNAKCESCKPSFASCDTGGDCCSGVCSDKACQ